MSEIEDTMFVDATRENLIQAICYRSNAKTTMVILQGMNPDDLLWEARGLNLILGYDINKVRRNNER